MCRMTRQFGSQTAKRKLEARLAAGVNAGTVGDAQALTQTLDTAAARAEAAGASRVRPACLPSMMLQAHLRAC